MTQFEPTISVDYRIPNAQRSDFYASTIVQQDFQDFIHYILTRVNTITGVAYKDDPSIMGWQLVGTSAFTYYSL